MNFSGKTIVVGVCGGIAAYRACDLIRELYRRGAKRVIPVMTRSAEQFITPLTLQALSHEQVWHWDAQVVGSYKTQESQTHIQETEIYQADTQVFVEKNTESDCGTPVHILLAQQADALLILPATVSMIGKFANGLADDLLSTTFMTFTNKPVVLVPAMNTRMWQHPIFQQNLKKLTALDFVHLVEPVPGLLACGETGDGHLADQETVLQQLYAVLHPRAGQLTGIHALVTAGGTAEGIDPVREITNKSSGKMGLALADELWAMGAQVTLLSARPELAFSRPYPVLPFHTTRQLDALLAQQFDTCDWLLMAAAVSDFRVSNPASQKIKKAESAGNPNGDITLALSLNEDLLTKYAARKQPHQRCIGFAAESRDLLDNAQSKLHRKNLDAIIANDISRPDIGFQADENEVTVLLPQQVPVFIPRAPKAEIAQEILIQLHQNFTQVLVSDKGSDKSNQTLTGSATSIN